MTAKQQIATGFLATLIVCSVAFMPANADSSSRAKAAPPQRPAVVTAKVSEAPNEAPHDLTYN